MQREGEDLPRGYSQIDFETAANGVFPGPDFEWFAVDRDFCVAGFSNAGFARIPPAVFQSFKRFCSTRDAVCRLPRTGNSNLLRPGRVDTWEFWSGRGLFAFDWDHDIGHPDPSRPYRLIAYPENPIDLSAFSVGVADYIAQVCFKDISFRDTHEIFTE